MALKSAFDMVDTSGDGELDLDELRLLLESLGQQHTEAELRDEVRKLDKAGSGTVDFDEFVTLMRQWQYEELRQIFEYFDQDRSGHMDVGELELAIKSLGEDLTPSEISELANNVDVDNDNS